MALLPKRDLLQEALESGEVLQEFRTYIGMSSLMGKCKRKTWYNFRWAYNRYVQKRIQRIFDRGDLEEARVIADLRACGVIVTECLDEQTELVDDTGHIRGHKDGKCMNVPTAEKTPHLLEVKTMKDSQFKLYIKQGLEKSHPTYWGQIHTYMGEEKLKRCLFVAVNKDTEERRYERFHYDKSVHEEAMGIGFDILVSEFPPPKIGEITWYECKMCDARGICHKGDPIRRSCRTCEHVNIEMGGRWSCSFHNIDDIAYDVQLQGCGQYELSEVFK